MAWRSAWRIYLCASYTLFFGSITILNLDKLRRETADLEAVNGSSTNFIARLPTSDRILSQLSGDSWRTSGKQIKVAVLGAGHLAGTPLGAGVFVKDGCAAGNCVLVREVKDADVVLTDGLDVDWDVYAELRSPSQLWVYYQLEPPTYTQGLPEFDEISFNYTATYHLDSDLVTPYAKFVHIDEVPSDQVPKRGWPDKIEIDLQGKEFAAAWVVSHCVTRSKRELYAKELAKHMRVEVFGRCGPNTCSRYSPHCKKTLNKYMFYLSFENSLCEDYITEKFFEHGLSNNLVPIVLGARRQDYERVAPPHSFIHVDDFPSASQLAAYLSYLHKNVTAYREYFAWKGNFVPINTKFWCRLCGLVNRRPSRVYDSIRQWWLAPGRCVGDL